MANSFVRPAMPCRVRTLVPGPIFGRTFGWAFGLAVWLVLSIPAAADEPKPDSASVPEVVLAVGNFDGRCPADSLYGRSSDSRHYLPTRIVWGSAACPGDSLYPPPTYPETTFEYPAWDDLAGTVSVQRINGGDSVTDLVFMIGGRTTGTEPADTLRRICLFGGLGLRSVPTVNLGVLPAAQIAPFGALDLVLGTHLVEPDERDMTGRTSWVLLPVEAPGPMPRTELAAVEPAPVAWNVRVSPNPTRGAARIEGYPFPAGEYRVEVIAVDGAIAAQRRVSVGASGGLFDLLDLAELATGFYVIRVYGADAAAGRLIGTYPIIKQR